MFNDDPWWTANDDPRPPLVWIADDSPLETQIVRRSLGDGYDVEVFSDGSSLLERLAQSRRRPDILLLDWVMPGISGEEVCRFLRAQPDTADLSILLVTASRIAVEDVVAGLAAGADDYVAKPFAPEELRARLAAVLRGKQLREAAQTQTRRLELIAHVARRLAAAGPAVQSVLDSMAQTLTETLGDGCLIGTRLDDAQGAAGAHPGATYRAICHRDPGRSAQLREMLGRDAGPECDWGKLGDSVTATNPGRVLHFEGPDALRAFVPRLHPYLVQWGVKGGVLAPLRDRTGSRGAVVLWRGADGAPFSRGDRALLDTCLEYGSLAFQNAQLYESERRNAHFQEQFMGIVGHDLRNPISAISMTAALLSRRLGPREAPAIGRITASAERMRRMVDQLLDLAMARLGGGIVIVPRPAELGALTREVIDELQVAYPQCPFVVQIEPDIHGEWDPDRLEQAISNIAANAIQHGRQGCPVTISVLRTGEEGVLEVHNQNDPGEEIPQELLPVLFDPFRRGRSEQRRSQGLGLGLFITREIVLGHGGRIEVESSPEAGTRFRISLPLQRAASTP